jgi:hypothetical protein
VLPCIVYHVKILNIKPGKTWIDKSTSDGNQKGEDENEERIYDYVIDRDGYNGGGIDNNTLVHVDGES